MVVHHGSNFNPTLVLLSLLVLLAVYVPIVIYCLKDLYMPERRVKGYTKDVWALIIIIGSVIGIMAYFLIGRED